MVAVHLFETHSPQYLPPPTDHQLIYSSSNHNDEFNETQSARAEYSEYILSRNPNLLLHPQLPYDLAINYHSTGPITANFLLSVLRRAIAAGMDAEAGLVRVALRLCLTEHNDTRMAEIFVNVANVDLAPVLKEGGANHWPKVVCAALETVKWVLGKGFKPDDPEALVDYMRQKVVECAFHAQRSCNDADRKALESCGERLSKGIEFWEEWIRGNEAVVKE
ncbi:hypothetical protein HDV00_009657 [Rhizophlyctis rosea]|nr:hypothetical protein HDV00_009657 [Rhizophlyctis rosea]